MNQSYTKTFSEWMRILLTAFFSRVRLVLLIPFFCGLFTWLICSILSPVYSGGFSILIRAPEVDKSTLEAGTSVVVRPGVIMENIISDEIYLLKSHALYREIAQNIKSVEALKSGYLATTKLPDRFLRYFVAIKGDIKKILQKYIRRKDVTGSDVSPIESMASAVRAMSVVEQQKGSDVIEVRIKHHNARLIMEILNVYLMKYHDLRNKVWFNKNATGFFRTQTETYYDQWQRLVDKLIKLKEEYNLIEPDKEMKKYQEQLMNFTSEFMKLKTTMNELKMKMKLVVSMSPEKSLTFMPERIEVDRLFKEIKTMVGQAKAERSKLLRNFKVKSTAVSKIDYQLADLYTQYKQLLTGYFENKFNRSSIRLEALSDTIKEIKQRLFKLNKFGQQVKVLEEKTELYRKQYSSHMIRTMNAKVQKELRKSASTVKVISAPFVDSIPVWPKKKIFTVLSVLLGFLLTMLFTIFVQLMKDSFNLPEEISQELNLPVLASFPLKANTGGLGSERRMSFLLSNYVAKFHRHRKLLTVIGVVIFVLLMSWIWYLKPVASRDEKKGIPIGRKAIETEKDLRKKSVNKKEAKEAISDQLLQAGLLPLLSSLHDKEVVGIKTISDRSGHSLIRRKIHKNKINLDDQENKTNTKTMVSASDPGNIKKPGDLKHHFSESKPLTKKWFYIVRLGLYRIKQNALDMYEQMKGYSVIIKRVNNPKVGSVYAVQLRPLTDRSAARVLISQIKRQKGLTAVMLKRQ